MGRLLDEDDVIDWLLKRTEMYDATGHFVDENVVKKNIESQIAKIPSAQPDTDEWCYDCKEYDPSRHCCPRFNRVIRETLKEAQPEQRWIPCSEKLPDEKDVGIKKRSDYVIATVEVKGKRMTATACTYDGAWDWADFKVVAWMPLPEPYEGGNDV